MLSNDFLSKYKTLPFPGTDLGHFVYLRTYSRWLDSERRREAWWETVARVVEYSMSLYSGHKDVQADAEQLYDDIFNLRVFPAGRTLWLGGSKAAEKHAVGNFNCAFLVVKDIQSYGELFYLLMVGTGVGFRVLPGDVAQFPKFYPRKLINKPYVPKNKSERHDQTQVNGLTITVGDSKEGWVKALTEYLHFHTVNPVGDIVIDYNNVRPKGEPLVTFGGRASGPDGLSKLFIGINEIINNLPNGYLRSVDAMDIANLIGEAVVVGGVRRTSEITLFSPNDNDILDAKLGLYEDGSPNYGKFYRAMSNNTIFLENDVTLEFLQDILQRTRTNGEPGFINVKAARARRPNFNGINPCIVGETEILTSDGKRKVLDLLDKPFTAIVDGKPFTSSIGFWYSGNKPVYKINTEEGYSVTLTLNHQVLTKNGWTRAQDLIPGDEIRVNSENGVPRPAFRKWAKVIDLAYRGMKDVYDCSVDEINCFSANDLIIHNCAEILLDDRGLCNLSTINCMADIGNYTYPMFVNELMRRAEIATMIGIRQTNVDIDLPEWDKIQKRDRLIGVSLTGWMDMVDYFEISEIDQSELLTILKNTVNNVALEYAKELRIPAPLLTTCVKPEGTLSQLQTVSSGVHRSFAPYYVRRIRISAHDPLATVMSNLNYPIYPEGINPITFDELNSLEKFSRLQGASTWVIEFPVMSQAKVKASDESAIDQFERYLNFQEHYSEHNTSITITVDDDEWDKMASVLYDNWDNLVAVSFLPKDTNSYPLMPYEAITKQEYELRKSQIKIGDMVEMLRQEELVYYETSDGELDPGCESGVCPPR